MAKGIRKSLVGWSFVSLSVIGIALFAFYPMIEALFLSFRAGMGNNLEFVGIDNYIRLLKDPTFKTALTNTIIFLLFQVPIMLLLALIFAVLLNSPHVRFKSFFRTAIYLPSITSLVAYAVIFKYLFSLDGIVNKILVGLSILDEPINWLTDPLLAKIVIIIAITWRWTGYNMIFYLAGLQNIDKSIYEAARIDGASSIQQFFYITVPLLKPIILFTSITSTIGTLQLFDEPMNITNGGPGIATTTISQYIYNLSFEYTPDFGYAATVSYVILIIIAILTLIQFRFSGDRYE